MLIFIPSRISVHFLFPAQFSDLVRLDLKTSEQGASVPYCSEVAVNKYKLTVAIGS
jgi:hypothetical protein